LAPLVTATRLDSPSGLHRVVRAGDGALNPKVRQESIRKTICKSGWTKKIRPPVSYTNALKIKQMVQYGEGGSPSDYEEDHFIPLELGGAPKNQKTFGLSHEYRLGSRIRWKRSLTGRFANG
jgi:hypothetical protein